jgi:hypothetical protein
MVGEGELSSYSSCSFGPKQSARPRDIGNRSVDSKLVAK